MDDQRNDPTCSEIVVNSIGGLLLLVASLFFLVGGPVELLNKWGVQSAPSGNPPTFVERLIMALPQFIIGTLLLLATHFVLGSIKRK